jgi:hypothetical protein
VKSNLDGLGGLSGLSGLSGQGGVDLAAVDRALGLDEDTRAARDKLINGVAGVWSEEQLWELYRGHAIPPGAPLVQLTETRRAIRWAVAALSQIVTDPTRLASLVESVQAAGLEELRGRVGR